MEVDNHQRRKEEVEECLRGREELREWGKKHNTQKKMVWRGDQRESKRHGNIKR